MKVRGLSSRLEIVSHDTFSSSRYIVTSDFAPPSVATGASSNLYRVRPEILLGRLYLNTTQLSCHGDIVPVLFQPPPISIAGRRSLPRNNLTDAAIRWAR